LNLTATFTESKPQLNETLEVVQFAQSWYVNDWFGYFFQSPNGWCYHISLGWIYPEPEKDGSIWVWSGQLEWLWMDASSYANKYAWSAKDNNWVYFDFESENGVKIYRFIHETWETFDKNKIVSIEDTLF
jgi:hypothetical protein